MFAIANLAGAVYNHFRSMLTNKPDNGWVRRRPLVPRALLAPLCSCYVRVGSCLLS
jgi:hypothetical protein